MLLTAVRKTVERYNMLSSGDRVIVAVSGGPDSVCLLGVLQELATDLALTLHIAHLDHMFRGKESADEALFVARLAKKFNIAATIEKYDVPAYCVERGLSRQAGAREARYAFLDRTAKNIGAQRIALGHTAQDQAETFLMRLLRGAGASGLSGIPPKREKIIRPLIDVTRAEILGYLGRNSLEFVTDSSNLKPVYERNRVRLELLPALERFNPRIVETLAAEATLLRDEDEAMEAYLGTFASTVLSGADDTVRIQREDFIRLLPAVRRRLLRKAIETTGADPQNISFIQIEDALAFMFHAQTGRAIELPHGLSIAREYDTFLVRPNTKPIEFRIQLAVPGVTALPGLGRDIETRVGDTPAGEMGNTNYLWQAVFDYDKIRLPLFVRNRRAGDSFHPSGMGGKSKKLQDYFVDEKVPRLLRDAVPVLCTETDIVGIVGMRTDERFVPDSGTKRFLTVSVRNANDLG